MPKALAPQVKALPEGGWKMNEERRAVRLFATGD